MVKVCPFCKSNKDLVVYPNYETYNEIVEKYGRACVSLKCNKCDVEMFMFGKEDYTLKVRNLIAKWNYRGWDEP